MSSVLLLPLSWCWLGTSKGKNSKIRTLAKYLFCFFTSIQLRVLNSVVFWTMTLQLSLVLCDWAIYQHVSFYFLHTSVSAFTEVAQKIPFPCYNYNSLSQDFIFSLSFHFCGKVMTIHNQVLVYQWKIDKKHRSLKERQLCLNICFSEGRNGFIWDGKYVFMDTKLFFCGALVHFLHSNTGFYVSKGSLMP